MQPRMKNPAMIMPEAMTGIQRLLKATKSGGVPQPTLELIGLRVSQLNGCAPCLVGHQREARKAGETDERLATVAAWREAPFFTDAERAALQLAEAITRLSDRSEEAVPDELWEAVVEHYDEQQLSAILLMIGTINLFNRINVPIRERADRPSWE
ncbi:alkylhydroperoxidase AhpD family core domain-containing protein [Saccharopolyspora antimicrobica]|uniref:AhpD family alkylhydroperoxidase n=1 Tax=Saccharopolyspora antimicrobica TaxID=455193 RepID=A0A1I4THC2_9PSEU|nr:carboxymuconolactone decarboxylase family protein [Saccharopolyspora antimicrobica]RKT85720.1 AhpD family alkylhydroperoxidase [Saccharopolyspora antimicrobica]SFM76043.1 alkylhydroperoxidase AhpD family core domain-containing protein [Saccharopolyspora antimicrobica]